MGIFDNYNYEINKRLPEFWKSDIFLTPIERMSAIIMRDTVQRFMEKMGVMQPFMVWKTLPEEYDWEYGFEDYDVRLANNEENSNCNQTLILSETNHIVAQLPLTKRDVHGYIVIDLSSTSFSDTTEYTSIQELVIKNADQTLKIKDIDSKTVIEIYTESNTILINDSAPKANQVEGSLNIIKREPREAIENITDPLDINEKCELEIYIPTGEVAYCDLYIRLHYPVYVTEQNIRVFTLSAFPIEYVRLYGYMCHKYNNNHQWVYLWEKIYGYEDRIVYDRITKQYDCEIFYAEIKLYGLPAPMYVGFPATYADATEGVFSLNESLDYWGSIFHIPRRVYKTDILETEERYCFPKYYSYSVEQDYPYEQRLINEYKYNEDWQDYINIRDVDGTDIALVRCKDPYIHNIYMYTETIPPVDLLNSKTTFNATCIKQINHNNQDINRVVWENEDNLRYESNSYSIVTLNNQNEEHITDKSYQANLLSLEFDLTALPENCKIKGMQLKFKGVSNTHSENIYIDDRSFLKYTQKIRNDETGNHDWQTKEIPLSNYFDVWTPDNASYILGYEDSIFFEEGTIDRDSIEKGYLNNGVYQTNKIRFDIGFSNLSDYLDIIIKLFNIQLIVYFDLLEEDIDVSIDIPNKTIIYDDTQSTCIDVNLNFKNNGEIKEIDYNTFVIIPTELCFLDSNYNAETGTIKEFNLGNLTTTDYITDNREYNILHIDEDWDTTIKIMANNLAEENEPPLFKSGRYDILIICGGKILKEEVYIYDKQYAINNNITTSIKYTDNDVILSFDESSKNAINGITTIILTLKEKNQNPIPYQQVILRQENTQETFYLFTDKNGQIILPNVKVSNEDVFSAQYGSVNTLCKINSFCINFNLFKALKHQYNVLKTDDLNLLRWSLIKNNTTNNDIEYIIQQLIANQGIDITELDVPDSYIEKENNYKINVYHDSINIHDSYSIICFTNIVSTNPNTEQKQTYNVVCIFNISDIQQSITEQNLADEGLIFFREISKEVEND